MDLKNESLAVYELPTSSPTKLLPVLPRPFNRDKAITLREDYGNCVPGLSCLGKEFKGHIGSQSENLRIIEPTLPVGLRVTGGMAVACLCHGQFLGHGARKRKKFRFKRRHKLPYHLV